jgi:ParB family chromosome partitioning protein
LFIRDIQPNTEQPRRHFDEQALQELANSIKRYGILQPLIVSPYKNGFILVAGERRWRAARLAGLAQVPAIVREQQELEQLEIALIENVQRVDLSPLEQAVSIEKLHSQFNMSYSDIAKRLGKAVPTISNIVRLLELPVVAREALQTGTITEGHARAIVALKDLPEKQQELLQSIQKYGWSVRQAEQFVTSTREGATSRQAVSRRLATETPETKRLGKHLHTAVSVKRLAKGGRLEIHFKNDEELQALIDRLEKS